MHRVFLFRQSHVGTSFAVLDDNYTVGCDVNVESDEYSSSTSTSNNSDATSLLLDTALTDEFSFREHLASCFVHNNLTHVQGNKILSILRMHSCFSNLPKDVRTLINTPRNRATLSKVEPGEYIHLDVETEIIKSLSNVSFVCPNKLELDFSTYGCTLDKSGCIHIWPIQCRIANIQNTKPIVVGIYKGKQKPRDSNTFFEKFITDIRQIMSNGGINFRGNLVPIQLRSFIADAPARAFILNHRGHTSSQPCSKCKVSGIQMEGRRVFNDIRHPLRTDEDYRNCVDEDHHREGTSPLSLVSIGMISQVPFEYMKNI